MKTQLLTGYIAALAASFASILGIMSLPFIQRVHPLLAFGMSLVIALLGLPFGLLGGQISLYFGSSPRRAVFMSGLGGMLSLIIAVPFLLIFTLNATVLFVFILENIR